MLLTEHGRAKVADVGLARMIPATQSYLSGGNGALGWSMCSARLQMLAAWQAAAWCRQRLCNASEGRNSAAGLECRSGMLMCECVTPVLLPLNYHCAAVAAGTWPWAAPEQLFGQRCTSKADIYGYVSARQPSTCLSMCLSR